VLVLRFEPLAGTDDENDNKDERKSGFTKTHIMLRLIIFDFNGIISDDEHLHCTALRKVLEEEGIRITEEDYNSRYLGKDDRDCFQDALRARCSPLNGDLLESLIQRKSNYYLKAVEKNLQIFPGVIPFIQHAYTTCILAIASGALRREVEFVLERTNLKHYFSCIVTQEDVGRGKPDPEIFLKTLAVINRQQSSANMVVPAECLVIEDSRPGVKAALAAGMRCLAITNSFSESELSAAHRVLPNLTIPSELLNQWLQSW
jgi:beta-phosphoglucomutase